MSYIFTKKQFEELKKRILKTDKELKKVVKIKGETARSSTGDSWHSAEFMAAYVEEMQLRKRLSDLKSLTFGAEIIEPREQNEKVDVGNGVVVEYENGSQEEFFLDGYIIEAPKNHASIYSPLGKVLKGAKKGQIKTVKIQGTNQKIKILEILLPSKIK